jgi:hypothetical protein
MHGLRSPTSRPSELSPRFSGFAVLRLLYRRFEPDCPQVLPNIDTLSLKRLPVFNSTGPRGCVFV